MELKDKIKIRRHELGMTLEDVARVVGVGKSTVRKWETGYIENMRRDKIAKLAEALHTTPAYLMGWEESAEKPEEPKAEHARFPRDQMVAMPVREIDSIYDALNDPGQAELCRYGRYLTAQEEYKLAEPRPAPKAPARIVPLLGAAFAAGSPETPGDLFMSDYLTEDPRAEFAIRVNGDSMEPWLPDGSVALGVKRVPRDGEVAAFFLDGGFLVKQFCLDALGCVHLFSLNRSRSDADDDVAPDSGRDLRLVGTILMKDRLPLP